MIPVYVAKLSLTLRNTNVNTQKIDSLSLKTYGMAIAGFLVIDKFGQIRFFEESFLLAGINIQLVLKMSFFCLAT